MILDDIVRMARESGVWDTIGFPKEIERFAALVAAAEREACAKTCESAGPGADPIYCAFAIRARGETK